MNKEKLKNMFKGKKKTENIVVLIIILIVTVVAINYIWKNDKENTDINLKDESEKNIDDVVQVSNNYEEDEFEKKLEKILNKISGVGNVKVMITYSESSSVTPIYNEDTSVSNVNETDSSGGVRSTVETDSQKEIIFKENSDGSKEPVTQKVTSPKIEGAVVVASGADDTTVKANIIQAVEAATGLATHKIQVFKMEDNVN